jgi:hypothetical protein
MLAVVVELGRVQFSLRSLTKPETDETPAIATTQPTPAGDAAAARAEGETLAGGAGDDNVSKTADPVLPEPIEDDSPPTRGDTYTFDSEVSRLLGRRSVQVQVVQGSSVQQMTFDQ